MSFPANPPALLITLRAPGPDPNGAVLESWVLTAAELVDVPGSIKVLTSVANPFLAAGTGYWLRLESTIIDDEGLYFWFFNVTGWR